MRRLPAHSPFQTRRRRSNFTAMASHEQPSPLPPTTISALTDDLLREIFLRLPDLPTLARAAFTCRAFLRAVRSSPAFRRRFRKLHAAPIIALFIEPDMRAFVSRMSDSGTTGAFADLLRDDGSSVWRNASEAPCSDGYAFFINRNTEQSVWYNVHTQSLDIYPKKADVGVHTFLEFRTLPAHRDDQRPSRVLCVHHDHSWTWARVAVFSSHTMEWQVFPESRTPLLEGGRHSSGTVLKAFLCWLYEDNILALDTANFQFSRLGLPPHLRGPDLKSRFNIGQTKDGELCIVEVQECTLSVWLWTAVRFMLHKTFPLHTSVKEVTKRPVEDIVGVGLLLIIVIHGFVYLSVDYGGDPESWFLSVCLETTEVDFLFKRTCCSPLFDHYIMAWPPSLVHNKDSETEVTGDSVGDNGRVGKEEAFPVLFTALQSFKEALIDDDNVKFADMDAFLLDDEINSLQKKATTLESGFAAVTDRVLRMGARSNIRKERMKRETWWRMCKGMLRRARSRFSAS